MNRNLANVSLSKSSAIISNKSNSSSDDQTVIVSLHSILIVIKGFFLENLMLVIFNPSCHCLWSQMPWRNTCVDSIFLFYTYSFDLPNCQNLRSWEKYSPKHFVFSKHFLNFRLDPIEDLGIINVLIDII